MPFHFYICNFFILHVQFFEFEIFDKMGYGIKSHTVNEKEGKTHNLERLTHTVSLTVVMSVLSKITQI